MLVTICNYSFYQDPKNYESNKRADKRTTDPKQTTDTINKNGNNDNNVNNDKKKYLDKVFLTDDEYKKLTTEYYKNVIDNKIEDLNYYLIQNPKKTYVSHYLTIKAWIRKDKGNNNGTEDNMPILK